MLGRNHTVLFTIELYESSLMYNIISLRKVRRNGYRVEMDDYGNENSNGIIIIIDKNSNDVQLVGPEIDNGIFRKI